MKIWNFVLALILFSFKLCFSALRGTMLQTIYLFLVAWYLPMEKFKIFIVNSQTVSVS